MTGSITNLEDSDDFPEDIVWTAMQIAADIPTKVGPRNREFAARVIARALSVERAKQKPFHSLSRNEDTSAVRPETKDE
jgi:hypothetical protein